MVLMAFNGWDQRVLVGTALADFQFYHCARRVDFRRFTNRCFSKANAFATTMEKRVSFRLFLVLFVFYLVLGFTLLF
jgi:hypothetical protein